ncbi:MAG: hypothetical protein NT015_14330 [Alphaproteobacteria bacterium]|nr:hypothetical protein [Alphaproteobacteria bacterium]
MYLNREDPLFGKAAAGEVLRIPGRTPPWLIVSALGSTLFASWPGQYVLAEVVDAITEEEQRPYGGAPASWAGYTRAAAVRVVEIYHLPNIFGQHGDAVAAIVDATSTLTEAEATEMIARRHPEADAARERIEALVKRDLDRNGSGLGAPFEHGSPLGALYFLDLVVSERALAVVGDRAFEDDPDDPGAWLAEPWTGAVSVLWEAALAIGAPDIGAEGDRAVLMQGSESFRSRL